VEVDAVDTAAAEEERASGRTHVYSSLRLCSSGKLLADDAQPASSSPIWKRKDVAAAGAAGAGAAGACGGEGSTETTLRCVGCGWRGRSAPQLNDIPPPQQQQQQPAAVPAAASCASASCTGSLATTGN